MLLLLLLLLPQLGHQLKLLSAQRALPDEPHKRAALYRRCLPYCPRRWRPNTTSISSSCSSIVQTHAIDHADGGCCSGCGSSGSERADNRLNPGVRPWHTQQKVRPPRCPASAVASATANRSPPSLAIELDETQRSPWLLD